MLKRKKFKKFFQKNVYNARYENILKEANLKILPEEYFISIYLSIIGIMGLVLILTFFSLILFSSLVAAIIFYGGILVVVSVGILLYNYPVVLSKQRGVEIDASIPYLLPYMKILARELSLSKIVEIIDEFLIYKEIKTEFKKIKYYSDFMGYDINSSIRESMQSCPSRQLADLMNDLVTISNSGGDIYAYLERKWRNLDEEIDAIEKKNIDTLLIFSQIYVVLLLVSPLFYTIMTSILNLVEFSESAGGGGSSSTVMSIVILLVVLPFLYAGFMMLIYYSKPLYARLVPIKNE